MKRMFTLLLTVTLILCMNCTCFANTATSDKVPDINLNTLVELFPEAKLYIDNYKRLGNPIDKNLISRDFNLERTYSTYIDSTLYTLNIYSNGMLSLDFEITTRSTIIFDYYVWGLYQDFHQLVVSVAYYVDQNGNENITAIGAGGSGIHLHSYGVVRPFYAYAKANAYYVPEGMDYLEEEYFGMLLEVKRNDYGLLYKETTFTNVFPW